jgi:hypothetical protein
MPLPIQQAGEGTGAGIDSDGTLCYDTAMDGCGRARDRKGMAHLERLSLGRESVDEE